MKIETPIDWNGVLSGCGCCTMPVCAVPEYESETVYGTYGTGDYVSPLPRTDPDEIPGPFLSGNPGVAAGEKWPRQWGVVNTSTGALSFPITYDELVNGALQKCEGAAWSGFVSNGYATMVTSWPNYSGTAVSPGSVQYGYASATFYKVRFRWKIPTSWTGGYYKITWDIVDELSGGKSFHKEDQTWEWNGPGDPGTPSDWLSPWYEIQPSEVSGTNRHITNIRFECYKSAKFGKKPQVGVYGTDPWPLWDTAVVTNPDPEDDSGKQGQSGTSGPSGAIGNTGGLRTGGLRTGTLRTGTLRIGRLQIGGLRTGGLRIGGLRIGGLRIGSLRTGGLTTGTTRSGSLTTGNLRVTSIRTGSLRTGGLSSGGLRSGGLRTSSL